MKVKELRRVMDDCWFRIVKFGDDFSDDEILFDQTETFNEIPDKIGELKVWYAGVDTPYNNDSVIFVAIDADDMDE